MMSSATVLLLALSIICVEGHTIAGRMKNGSNSDLIDKVDSLTDLHKEGSAHVHENKGDKHGGTNVHVHINMENEGDDEDGDDKNNDENDKDNHHQHHDHHDHNAHHHDTHDHDAHHHDTNDHNAHHHDTHDHNAHHHDTHDHNVDHHDHHNHDHHEPHHHDHDDKEGHKEQDNHHHGDHKAHHDHDTDHHEMHQDHDDSHSHDNHDNHNHHNSDSHHKHHDIDHHGQHGHHDPHGDDKDHHNNDKEEDHNCHDQHYHHHDHRHHLHDKQDDHHNHGDHDNHHDHHHHDDKDHFHHHGVEDHHNHHDHDQHHDDDHQHGKTNSAKKSGCGCMKKNMKMTEEQSQSTGYHYARCDVTMDPMMNESPHLVKGSIFFRQQMSGPLEMIIDLNGFFVPLKAEQDHSLHMHGFHVHQYGDFSDGCQSFGGHFNPDNTHHGNHNGTHGHAGDWGNISCNELGQVHTNRNDSQTSLTGDHSIVGRGIVIHADADDLGQGGDESSSKTGNAGRRLACCPVVWSADLDWDLLMRHEH